MQFEEFKAKVMVSFRLDLNSYKEKQLKRRLDSYIVKLKLKGYEELYRQITQKREDYEKFLDHLTINVSEFFRDPHRFTELQQHLKEMFRDRNSVKIWSAACSNGSEPYSIAIILEEMGLAGRSSIDATDLDRQILNKARQARYNRDGLKNVSTERLQRFFDVQGDLYVLKDIVKKKISFRYHDLLNDEYQKNYDLIVCRNVTIYFTREAQDLIYKKFHRSLNTNGILFIGGSEMIFNYKELGYEKLSPCFYKKGT
ncbi:chemotaxis protein methyltransferase CheR [Desulfotomaculum arcticum]|uniref:Chemotaxis protein methyltransferase CheR n=1 Tax=Desulfotruncus arcticus DSM 17038 TaxID=1121424 RepID=A0A1I2MYX0_9FIRM|nr:protein-glutamate O-methyltransferase CheR [Desulfotruncus arcticus]SFF96298.1 chemotaxis protein methyltransferase CheR [Desulfotomaculum arcticum] [Desulfotruncus arcticus DSM 17038]